MAAIEIWSPLDILYRNAKGPLNEKASFIKDLLDKFPYITKYMDKEDPTEKLHLKCCKLALWGTFQIIQFGSVCGARTLSIIH